MKVVFLQMRALERTSWSLLVVEDCMLVCWSSDPPTRNQLVLLNRSPVTGCDINLKAAGLTCWGILFGSANLEMSGVVDRNLNLED